MPRTWNYKTASDTVIVLKQEVVIDVFVYINNIRYEFADVLILQTSHSNQDSL